MGSPHPQNIFFRFLKAVLDGIKVPSKIRHIYAVSDRHICAGGIYMPARKMHLSIVSLVNPNILFVIIYYFQQLQQYSSLGQYVIVLEALDVQWDLTLLTDEDTFSI